MRIRRSVTLAAALLVALAGPAMAAPTDAQKCEAAVELASGKYALCRLKAESKYTKTSDFDAVTSAFNKCAGKLQDKYDKAFESYGGSCPRVEPAGEFGVHLNECVAGVEVAVAGGSFPVGTICGDGAINAPEQCDVGNLNGATCASQGFAGGTLGCATGWTLDTSGCYATRWVDNGDGTATDNTTGLQWELKTDDGSVHDKDNTYTWNTTFGGTTPNGTAFTDFLGTLNGGVTVSGSTTTGCFAGKCDWRLPTIVELWGILDAQYGPGTGCTINPCTTIPGLTVSSVPSFYWSSSTDSVYSGGAWGVNFNDGTLFGGQKFGDIYVRAVRGGS